MYSKSKWFEEDAERNTRTQILSSRRLHCALAVLAFSCAPGTQRLKSPTCVMTEAALPVRGQVFPRGGSHFPLVLAETCHCCRADQWRG